MTEERRHGEKKVKTVRAFVSEFRGLSSTIKQKEVSAGHSGVYLQDIVKNDDIDLAFVKKLLADMKKATTPPKPSALGIVGKEHLTRWMRTHGDVAEKSIDYKRIIGYEDGRPFVVEVSHGVRKKKDADRILRVGMNWTPVLGDDPIPTLSDVIQTQRVDPHEPVTLIAHMANPRFEFVDRGKTRVDW